MNRKLLSIAALALVAALSTPLVQADDDDDDDDDRHAYREVRVHSVEKHYYRDDRGDHHRHRHWRKPKHHHGHHDYDEPAPRVYRESYPARRTSSPVPIIAGSVIGGVVGHDLGRGDPRDTAIGAVVGTIIGYQIVRHRD